MKHLLRDHSSLAEALDNPAPVAVEVEIEIPRGSFLKRGSSGHIDFVSPFPCPFNYGSIPGYIGGEGDLLDAIVLGPRLSPGVQTSVRAWVAIGLAERDLYDDKLICSIHPPTRAQYTAVLQFMRFYARCKGLLNRFRGRPGPSYCTGWQPVGDAMARALPIPEDWAGPSVGF